jgi:hypothetical protein
VSDRLDKQALGIEPGLALDTSGDDLASLRADVQRLMDMEAIRQLKYAYFRCLDTANLKELATLLHPEVMVHFVGGSYEWKLRGRDEYLQGIGAAFGPAAVAQHNGHHPEIQMLSATEATAIWYLADHMWILDHGALISGTALYVDRYLKQDGRWLISETRYQRLYEMNQTLETAPSLSAHYLARHGTKPQH